MARINIENEFWDDPRVKKLQKLFASEPTLFDHAEVIAIGTMVSLWKLAQHFVTEDGAFLPDDVFLAIPSKRYLIEANLITKKQNGYFVEGSKKHLAWLDKKKKSGARGGKAKAEKTLKKQQNYSKQMLANASKSKQTLPYILHPHPHSTSSFSSKIAKSKKNPSDDSAIAEINQRTSQLIARYCELWKEKYKTSVSFSGKWAGNAKTLVKDHGLNRSLELIEAFMQMPEFLNTRHSFEQILLKLATINHYAGTGVQITKTQLNNFDKAISNKVAGEAAAAHFLEDKK